MKFQAVPYVKFKVINREQPIFKIIRDEFMGPIERKPKPKKIPKKRVTNDSEKERKKDKNVKEVHDRKKREKENVNVQRAKRQPKKPKKLTPKDIEETDRLKREEQIRIQAEKEAEENVKFIFPLKLAADDEFSQSVFQDYASSETVEQEKIKKNKKKKK